ncbi:unnamed protein product [Arctia plantaginis]|uniref:SEC63 domain-containing protein n=1 Tax=Arctia plantaginis TaxID=874455 RepID=A0A8S1BLZ1_ARCPL|nr:unnamed protein product [Arctia plantaginis]
MNGLASSGLITMDEASCIESTEAGRLMSIFYLDVETMKLLMRIEGTESLEGLLAIICESHELSDMHLRIDERRCLNALNRNHSAATIRFPMKGKISTRQMKLNCVIQAVLGCLAIPDPSLNQEAMKIMRIADRVCKCLVAYVTRPDLVSRQPKFYSVVLNSIVLAKCIAAHLWENSPFVSKQLKGIGPTFSMLLATAGKVNFMLLEESHPRDLERIMNKGPPAVGLDVQSEYIFKDLNKFFGPPNANYTINEIFMNDTVEKENESLRKRKRNNSTDADKNQSKGKKKRENAVIKNFEYLKKKFETESQVIKENCNLNSKNNEGVTHNDILSTEIVSQNKINAEYNNISKDMNLVLKNRDNFIDNDEKINNIITEIENEMSKRKIYKKKSNLKHLANISETENSQHSSAFKCEPINKIPYQHKLKTRKALPAKSNYTFIDLLEKNVSDDNDETVETSSYHGFSDTVKSYINKFILKTESETKIHDTNLPSLLVNEDKAVSDKKEYSNEIEIAVSNSVNNLSTQKLYPHYEIKEILDGQKNIKESEVNSSPQKLVMKVPSNIGTGYNTTRQIADVLSPVLVQSDAVNITNIYHNNQNNSNISRVLNETFQKPNNLHDAYETNSDNIHVDYNKNEAETNRDNITLLDKEMVLPTKRDSVKIEEIPSDILPFKRKSTNTTDISPKKISIIEGYNLSVMPVTYEPYEFTLIDSTGGKTIQKNSQGIEEVSDKRCHESYEFNKTLSLMTDDYKSAIIPKHLTYLDRCQIINATTVSNNNDQQIISEPVCTNNYDHPKLLNYCSSNEYCNRNRNEYVKKYYLSTRQIDIGTTEIADCNIQIIKEIKMDLKITAIVSASRSQQNYSAESDLIKSDNIKKLENNPPPMSTHDNVQNGSDDNQCTIQCIQPAVNWDLQKKDEKNKTGHQVLVSSNRAAEHTKNMFYDGSYSNCKEMNSIQGISEYLHPNVRESMEPVNTVNNKINYDSDYLNSVKHLSGMAMNGTQGKENNNIVNTPPNKVHNILQKYSKIFEKETNKDQPPVYSAPNKNTTNKRTPPKSKKPFKISKIEDLQETVPETMIHSRKQNQQISMPTKLVSNELILKKNEETQCNNIQFKGDYINDWRSYESITDIDLEPLNIPAEISLEPDIDHNFDQSMFDPKTLLQCTFDTDSKEIYTPPPQFCDFNTDLQNHYDAEDPDVTNTSKRFDESRIGIPVDTEFNCDESIFEDGCTPNLTPTREIETWTLGEPERSEERNFSLSLSPAKSFTVELTPFNLKETWCVQDPRLCLVTEKQALTTTLYS